MPHIIISYRRADTDAIAGRIRDRLASHYGDSSIFMDVDSIPFGIDFRVHIKEALASNDILIAIIGPKWLGHGRGGSLRIMEETDPVRIEVETALKSGSAVIPVLVAGAGMPDPSELPEGLKDFAYRNAAEVELGRDFNQHMERLIRSMDMILAAKYPGMARPAETPAPIIVPTSPAPVAPTPPVQSEPPREARPAPRPVPQPAPQPRPAVDTPVYAAAAIPTPAPAPQPRSKALLIIYPLAAVAIAALGGGGVWFYMKKPADAPVTTAQPKIENSGGYRHTAGAGVGQRHGNDRLQARRSDCVCGRFQDRRSGLDADGGRLLPRGRDAGAQGDREQDHPRDLSAAALQEPDRLRQVQGPLAAQIERRRYRWRRDVLGDRHVEFLSGEHLSKRHVFDLSDGQRYLGPGRAEDAI